MNLPRELLVANGVALLVLVLVMFLGWREAAAFGLATLVILNLLVGLRGRQAHNATLSEEPDDLPEETEGGTRE
jgi:hypothetical protein